MAKRPGEPPRLAGGGDLVGVSRMPFYAGPAPPPFATAR